MYLGEYLTDEDAGCSRCGRWREQNALIGALHDLTCWGWRTALYNLRFRLRDTED